MQVTFLYLKKLPSRAQWSATSQGDFYRPAPSPIQYDLLSYSLLGLLRSSRVIGFVFAQNFDRCHLDRIAARYKLRIESYCTLYLNSMKFTNEDLGPAISLSKCSSCVAAEANIQGAAAMPANRALMRVAPALLSLLGSPTRGSCQQSRKPTIDIG
jgi:hypothetical protein